MSETTPEFLALVKQRDICSIRRMLQLDPTLAGNNFMPGSLHTDGFPLYHATKVGDLELVQLLLDNGAEPDSSLDSSNPRESGMPLIHAFQGGNFSMIHQLLDHGAKTDAYGYCATPFTDQVCNSLWKYPDWNLACLQLIEQAFASWFAEGDTISDESTNIGTPTSTKQPEELLLLERIVEMDGKPSLFTVVRHEHHDLIRRLLRECPDRDGTKMDWPQGTTFSNLCYGASWAGYPQTLLDAREICPELFTESVSKHCIDRAIRSHSRDGEFETYLQLIDNELQFLNSTNTLSAEFPDGTPFLPLHQLARDFIESSHYGFKCETMLTQQDLVRMADLFVEYGFDCNLKDPGTGETPLDLAKKHELPEYVSFLGNRDTESSSRSRT